MKKEPITHILTQRGLAENADKAVALVVCKNVYVNGELCTNPKQVFGKDVAIDILYPKFVSRGGFKLERALEAFQIDVKGKTILDAGSSTGGFTDCLLQRGAEAVHAVDVGFNQLSYNLRNDSRVIVHEKQNIMTLEADSLEPPADIATADLSFRSIRGAASHILSLTRERMLIVLIKPQFEVPKECEGFHGVVDDPRLLKDTLTSVFEALLADGVGIYNAVQSPIKGRKGNTEYLALLKDMSPLAMSSGDFLTCLSL